MTLLAEADSPAIVNGLAAILESKALSADTVSPIFREKSFHRLEAGDVIVRVEAAAVNPSDVKAAIGMMAHAVFPRTPGRDFAGIVVEGPTEWVGKPVFGSSGNLGIRRDGTHATHVVVPRGGLVAKPDRLSFPQAAGIGVPFVTAAEGYRRAGWPNPDDVVVIMGINGKVGQAAAQIATWKGARVIGVARSSADYIGHASSAIPVVRLDDIDVAEKLRALTGDGGASLIFNTVGDPFFALAHTILAKDGRQIFIASINPTVGFNIFEFYRGRHSYFGLDTLALDCTASGERLRALLAGFDDGNLRPYAEVDAARFSLRQLPAAYAAVMASTPNRVILQPQQPDA